MPNSANPPLLKPDFPAPTQGFVVTTLLIVSDVARSRAFYERGIAQSGNGTQNSDLHWDGSTLLFTAVTSGSFTQIVLYIGKAASLVQGGDGIQVADRDQSGVEESWHSATMFGPWLNHNYNMLGESRFVFGVSQGSIGDRATCRQRHRDLLRALPHWVGSTHQRAQMDCS